MSTLRPLSLDFTRTRPRLSWGGMLLLCAGLAASVAVVLDYADRRDDLAAERHQGENLRRKIDLGGPALEHGEAAAAAQATRSATRAAALLKLPWDLLLLELEAAVDDAVALTSVEPDAERGQVRITGESRKLADVLAFVERLEGTASLNRVALAGHETHQSDGVSVVAFTILARWGGR